MQSQFPSTSKFTPMKLQLLKTSKPEIELSLLESQTQPSKTQKILLKESFILNMGLQGVANILNLILSNFGDMSIYDFRNLDLNQRTIYIRFYSFRASKSFFNHQSNFEGLEKSEFLQEFCSYKFSDKLIFSTNRGFEQRHIFNVLTTFGEIRKFNKISMKKIMVKFDDERSLLKLNKAQDLQNEEGLSLLDDLEDEFKWVVKSCILFISEKNKTLYFENTNPFKLRKAAVKKNQRKISKLGNFEKENQGGKFQNLQNWSPNFNQNSNSTQPKFDSNLLGFFTQRHQNSNNLNFSAFNKTPQKSMIFTSKKSKETMKLNFKIDIVKINSGIDTRSTLMIRNIPNAYTQEELIKRLNLRIEGLYDFFYLPIDFTNDCNLGYAFINLISVPAILALIEEFNGKKWPLKKSSKVCELKFARIQGRNRLINHFKRGNLLKNANNEQKDYIPFVIPNDILDSQIF